MFLTLELDTKLEQALVRVAATWGVEISEVARALLADATAQEQSAEPTISGAAGDFASFFEEMAQFSDKVPHLSTAAFSRESIYTEQH